MALKKLQVESGIHAYCIISIKEYIYYNDYELIIQRDLKGNTKTFKGHTDQILCFSVIDDYLYSSGYDGQIIKWDDDGSILDTIKTEQSIYYIMNINGVLYSSNNIGEIQKHDKNNTTTITFNPEKNPSDYITSNGIDLYYENGYHICKINLDTLEFTKVIERCDTNINTNINCMKFYNNFLYTGGSDNLLRRSNGTKLEIIYKCDYQITYFTFYNNYIYVGNSNGDIVQLNLNGNVKHIYNVHTKWISCIQVIRNCIYSCSYDEKIVKLGEFYLRDYFNLSQESKNILFEVAKVFYRLNIHKDIRLMIFRELL
jgi:WD40 repeat protein